MANSKRNGCDGLGIMGFLWNRLAVPLRPFFHPVFHKSNTLPWVLLRRLSLSRRKKIVLKHRPRTEPLHYLPQPAFLQSAIFLWVLFRDLTIRQERKIQLNRHVKSAEASSKSTVKTKRGALLAVVPVGGDEEERGSSAGSSSANQTAGEP